MTSMVPNTLEYWGRRALSLPQVQVRWMPIQGDTSSRWRWNVRCMAMPRAGRRTSCRRGGRTRADITGSKVRRESRLRRGGRPVGTMNWDGVRDRFELSGSARAGV